MTDSTIPATNVGGVHFEQLKDKIANKTATIGVIGLGYVGIPLIDAFRRNGFSAIGFDIDPMKVEKLKNGESYIAHIDSAVIQAWQEDGKFDASTDFSRFAEVDALLICVPTPLSESRDPELKYVVDTTREISKHLRPGQLVALESTTFPGTTTEVLLPILNESGLKVGEDFFLAYSPEREDPGNANFVAATIPKVVGGYDPQSLELADRLYASAVTATVPVKSCEVAEACKILENTYRSVNIAMVNELKVLFERMGIDVWEVIEAAKTKPFGYQAFYPGPGLGGHCIPIDPFYLTWVARKYEMPTRFIELAGEINTSMPNYVVRRVAEALNHHGKPIKGSKIGIFGIAYKKDIDDHRESPSFRIMELLIEQGAQVSYCDPHIAKVPAPMRSFDLPELVSESFSEDYIGSLDCAVIATNHSCFDYELLVRQSKLIVDTRNATANIQGQVEAIWKA